jgi:tetratricopeptide (TPR) repeat protein
LGRVEPAIEALSHSIQLVPSYYDPRLQRGWLYFDMGKSAEAIDDFRQVQRLLREQHESGPANLLAARMLAWSLATLPLAEVRNGADAVKLATIVCESTQWKDSQSLRTLAAAYAESGDFEQAEKYQLRAVETAAVYEKESMQGELELYRSKMPYRTR